MPKYINEEIWFSNIEIDDFLNDPQNTIAHLTMAERADLLADIGEQMATDDLVEDSFKEALFADAQSGDLDYSDFYEASDLCDIVEAVEKGRIIYG